MEIETKAILRYGSIIILAAIVIGGGYLFKTGKDVAEKEVDMSNPTPSSTPAKSLLTSMDRSLAGQSGVPGTTANQYQFDTDSTIGQTNNGSKASNTANRVQSGNSNNTGSSYSGTTGASSVGGSSGSSGSVSSANNSSSNTSIGANSGTGSSGGSSSGGSGNTGGTDLSSIPSTNDPSYSGPPRLIEGANPIN